MITDIHYDNTTSDMVVKRVLTPENLFIMVVFDTIESRDQFAKQFPKSLRVQVSVMLGHEWNGIDRLISLYYPFCSMRISRISEVTGHSNETGYKRMNRFYDAVLKQYDLEGSTDLAGLMDKYALTKNPRSTS